VSEGSTRLATAPTERNMPSALGHILSNWGGFVFSSIIALFLSPFVVHHLGNSAYGLWILCGSLTWYLGLFNLGVGTAVTRYVAKFYAEANDREASSVVSSAMAIFLAGGAAAIFVSLILAAFVMPLFHVPEGYRFAARVVVILAGFNLAASFIGQVFSGTVSGLHRFDIFNLIAVFNSALTAVAIVLVLAHGKGLIALALIYLSFTVATGFAYAGVAKRLFPALKIRLGQCDRKHLKMIFSFSAYAFLLQVSLSLIFYTDSIIIGAFLSVSMVTFFAIAGNLMFYSRSLISGISSIMIPRASALETGGSREQVQMLTLKATRFASVVILPIAITFLIRGSSFIGLWMGPEYAGPSGRVLWILSLGLIFFAADQVATYTMMGLNKQKLVVLVVCAEALCNIALSVALVRSMGIFGVAWGTTLPSLAVSLLFWPWYMNRALGISIRDYVVSTWLRPAAAAIPFGLLTYGFERWQPASNLFVYFMQIAAILPTFILASWFLCFDHSDREAYGEKFLQPFLKNFGWS
jgi:O-antigen/teichoic acid export membrane protein